MTISSHTQAILLLTAYFSKLTENDVKPLTPKEWTRFALWLEQKQLMPAHLLTGQLIELLKEWSDKDISLERLEKLINRGSALAVAMEKWTRAGLWTLTPTDDFYPSYLKKQLHADAPAILFGCGNQKLLNRGGIAVVGSRQISEEELQFSRNLGQMVAEQGFTLISGGARGVDETAMLGALTHAGTVVAVLAESLLRACCSAQYRPYLMSDNLVLISSFYPEAGFNVGNAMSRNKYIYCLSDTAVVVRSDKKGGTWSGALENLRKQWVTLWVKPTVDPLAGNADLVQAGGQWLPGIDSSLWAVQNLLITQSSSMHEKISPKNHLDTLVELDFYDLFLLKIQKICQSQAKTPKELVEQLNIDKRQLNIWLKRAIGAGKVKQLFKPHRYQWQDALPEQKTFF